MISPTLPAWFDQLIELNEHMKRATSLAALAWCVADLRRQGADKQADAALCVGKYGFDPDDKLTDADFAERIDNISKAKYVGWIRRIENDVSPLAVEAMYVTVQGPDNKRVRRTFRVKPELARTIIAMGQFKDFPNTQHKGEAPGKVADDFLTSIAADPKFKAGA